MKSTVAKETKQVGKFGIVGILNTIIDFGLYNILINFAHFGAIPANVCSTTVAMTFSFIANKTFVFGQKEGNTLRQVILFLLVTAFGLYVIQNIIIYFLTQIWHWPLDFGYSFVGFIGLDGLLSEEFVFTNGDKVIAKLFSLIWNYVLYKKVVFKKP